MTWDFVLGMTAGFFLYLLAAFMWNWMTRLFEEGDDG